MARRTTPKIFWNLVRTDPYNSTILLIGPPGVGKTILVNQMVYDRLNDDVPCVYICTDVSPSEVILRMKTFDWDVTEYVKSGELRFVDCYSWKSQIRADQQKELPELRRYVISGSSRLNELSIAIAEAAEDREGTNFWFDSISTLTREVGEEMALHFLELFCGRASSLGIGTATLTRGAHSESFESSLRASFDSVFEMDLKDTEEGLLRYFRIYSMRQSQHDTRWYALDITEKGIVLSEPPFSREFSEKKYSSS